MSATQQICQAPFDEIAARYDEVFTSSRIGQAQRASVWRELARTFCPGDRVLEIGCGTGVDACFLARRGMQVLASDSSAQMVAVTGRRIAEERLQHLVQPIVLPAEELAMLPGSNLFDGAFSNFGVINCIHDLRDLAVNLHRRLKPGAKLLLCPFAAYCVWEIAWYLAHLEPRKAFRRLGSQNAASVARGTPVHVSYPTVRSLKKIFAPEFRLMSAKGVGILVPPSYVESWANRFPWLLTLAIQADTEIECWSGLHSLADHVLLTFERKGK